MRKRNQAIIKEVLNQVNENNCVLVFACSVAHAKLLAAEISMMDVKSASITSDMRKVTRSKIIHDFKRGDIKVLTNFGILTTGFDAPNIGAVFITRPTQSLILYTVK